MSRRLAVVLAFTITIACGGPANPTIPKQLGRVDAPYELAADDDLGEVRAQFDALPLSDATRGQARSQLAVEYRRRIAAALRMGERDIAFARFEELMRMWRPDELAEAYQDSNFAALAPVAESIRRTFAKSGNDIEAASALYARALMNPDEAQQHLAGVEEIFKYADELAISEYGAGGARARPIVILEKTLEFLPSAAAVERLVALYVERQSAIKSVFRRQNDDAQQILAYHGPGVLTATRNIIRALALGGQMNRALGAIEPISGIGDDAKLRSLVRAALQSTDPSPWLVLSAGFRGSEEDLGAALAMCHEAITRYPDAAMSYFCAGESARASDDALLAIRHYRRAIEIEPGHEQAAQALASLYEMRVSALSFRDRPNAAAKKLSDFEGLHRDAAKRNFQLKPDLASAYAVMARGLVSLGELAEAHSYLERSLVLRQSLSAYEYLGTIALRQGQFSQAQAHFTKALALPEGDVGDLFARAILRRLLAEALDGRDGPKGGRHQRESAFADWLGILRKYELSETGEAEARLEIGKLLFFLDKDEEAMTEFLAALRKNPGASGHADIVSFLLGHDRYQLAKDIFLDALGHHEVGQYFKIYMSLWLLAECEKRGIAADYHATNYLHALEGTLWSVQLGKYGLGERDGRDLEAMATTRGRRAELLYYRAVLGPERTSPAIVRELLSEVVRGSMVLFFEYEMAKRQLREMK